MTWKSVITRNPRLHARKGNGAGKDYTEASPLSGELFFEISGNKYLLHSLSEIFGNLICNSFGAHGTWCRFRIQFTLLCVASWSMVKESGVKTFILVSDFLKMLHISVNNGSQNIMHPFSKDKGVRTHSEVSHLHRVTPTCRLSQSRCSAAAAAAATTAARQVSDRNQGSAWWSAAWAESLAEAGGTWRCWFSRWRASCTWPGRCCSGSCGCRWSLPGESLIRVGGRRWQNARASARVEWLS